MKEIKDDINIWRDIPCSWTARINTVKMTILPKASYRFSTNDNFHGTRTKKPHNSYGNTKIWIVKATLRKKNGAGRINFPDFRLYCKPILQSYSHQDIMVLTQKQKYGPLEQDRKPEINPHTYGHLIFDKGGKIVSSAGKTGQLCKRMKLEHFLTPYTKINSKWIKDLKMCLLLLLSHFSHVWLCDPIDVSPPGSTIPGIL